MLWINTELICARLFISVVSILILSCESRFHSESYCSQELILVILLSCSNMSNNLICVIILKGAFLKFSITYQSTDTEFLWTCSCYLNYSNSSLLLFSSATQITRRDGCALFQTISLIIDDTDISSKAMRTILIFCSVHWT